MGDRRGVVVPWVVVVSALTIVALLIALRSARARAYAIGMRADSLAVAMDTLRVAHEVEQSRWQRRVAQWEIERTDLERRLGQVPAVVVRPVLVVDTVRLVDTVEVVGDSVRSATFVKYQRPVSLTARVTMPPPPGTATLDATLSLDTIPIGLRLLCGRAVDGVRPVTAEVVTPPWITLRLATPEARPEVCNSPVVARGGIPWYWLPVAALGGALLR